MSTIEVNNWTEEIVERSIKDWSGAPKWVRAAFKEASEGHSFVDIGCGFGRFFKWLVENRKSPFTYLGIDSSEWMIRKCKQLYGTSESHDFVVYDALEPYDFLDKPQYYTLLCNSMLIHLPFDQQEKVLYNIFDSTPRKAVFDIESKDGVGNLSRVNEEMGRPFYRTWNDPKEFECLVRQYSINYKLSKRSFHYGSGLARHVFVALSI